MSGELSGFSGCSLNNDDLFEFRERFKELTKEKEMLRDTKSESFQLIRRLEFHVRTLSEAREEDKKRIADLERELSNCIQEIDYLQDQLNMRSSDQNFPGEQLYSYQPGVAVTENLAEEVERLREQMKISESESSSVMQEIEDKEVPIRYSASHFQKLEKSISCMALEYQCEIESMKLESFSLEQNLVETKKLLEERTRENSEMNELIRDLHLRNKDANKVIESLEKENKDLKEKLRSICGSNLGPLFTKIAFPRASDAELSNKVAEMSCQIDDYELLVLQLKEELREERSKAKEEAEDLAQEMAELRYQLTVMLDEERKRRASIEQISLQRIAELEAQITKEQQKSISHQDLVVRNQ